MILICENNAKLRLYFLSLFSRFRRVVVRENDRYTQNDDFSDNFVDLRHQKNYYIGLLVVILCCVSDHNSIKIRIKKRDFVISHIFLSYLTSTFFGES